MGNINSYIKQLCINNVRGKVYINYKYINKNVRRTSTLLSTFLCWCIWPMHTQTPCQNQSISVSRGADAWVTRCRGNTEQPWPEAKALSFASMPGPYSTQYWMVGFRKHSKPYKTWLVSWLNNVSLLSRQRSNLHKRYFRQATSSANQSTATKLYPRFVQRFEMNLKTGISKVHITLSSNEWTNTWTQSLVKWFPMVPGSLLCENSQSSSVTPCSFIVWGPSAVFFH